VREISGDEAELIFRKLADEEVFVFCIGTLWGWRLMLRGKLVMGKSEVTLRAGTGGFTLRLDEDDMVFWYSEPGKMPLPESIPIPEEARDSACISVALPLRVRPGAFDVERSPVAPFREQLIFLEIRGDVPIGK